MFASLRILPCIFYALPLLCRLVVLIRSVFDLQLSLSQRDPSQRESLPTTPCCELKSEAESVADWKERAKRKRKGGDKARSPFDGERKAEAKSGKQRMW